MIMLETWSFMFRGLDCLERGSAADKQTDTDRRTDIFHPRTHAVIHAVIHARTHARTQLRQLRRLPVCPTV